MFALIPTLIISCILAFFFIFNHLNDVDEYIEEKGANILTPLAIVIEPALKDNNRKIITTLINQTHRKYASFIQSIAVFDKNNELITTSNFYKNFSALKIQTLYQLPVTPQLYKIDDKFIFYTPVYNTTYNLDRDSSQSPSRLVPTNNLLGYISVELNVDSYTLRKYQEVFFIIAALLFGYLIAMLIGQKLMHEISHPVNNMIDIIDLIRQGHLDARINGDLFGELDTLKKGINAMAISLGDFHMEMQQNVEQATSDLRETLEQLEIQNIELDIAKKRAQEAVRIKSEFLANITHELRTPLNGIIGFTQQMMKTNLAPNQLDYLKTIEKSGGNLLSIINDILDFSRLESGKLTLDHILFDFEKMLDEVIHFQSPIAHDKCLEITVDIQPDVPQSFVGDPSRIQRVITNLVGNAIKFTSHGNIDVSAKLNGITNNIAEIEISVKDQGIGISKEQQDSIFHAFQQADTSISRNYGGTGLGLVISQKLIERMNGSIDVSSQLNEGSDFFFTIKLPISKHIFENDTNSLNLQHKQILLIESNKTTSSIHQHQLQDAGAIVTVKETFDNIQDNFDCVIIGIAANAQSIELSELDSTLKKIKQHIPHLIVSLPSTELALAEQLFKSGISQCLDRPISKRRLLEAINKLLAKETQPIIINSSEDQYSKQEMSVLAVDDNPANLKLITALLSDYVTQIDSASDGAQALSFSHKKKYDLIFMDIQMPIMDGITTTKEIRDDKEGLNKKTPIIAVTAHTMDGEKDRLISLGMNDYLAKPMDENHLIKLINKWSNTSIVTPQIEEKPHTNTKKSIDWSVALRQSANKEDLAKEMLQMLIESFDDVKTTIESPFEDDSIPLVDIIHKLHGSCAYSGTVILKSLCNQVETALRSGGTIEDIEPELYEILDEMEHIKQDAPQYLDS